MDQLVTIKAGELGTTMNSYHISDEHDIIKEIKSRRVGWQGHLFRANEYFPL
jgi:hypothetical protein